MARSVAELLYERGGWITPLGMVPYRGPLPRLAAIRFDLFFYEDNRWGPSVAASWTARRGPELLTCSVNAEQGEIDLALLEAFRRARQRGLVS